jgi:protein-S-isoprenylcysteine O-methyltransferase Ste14
MDLQQGPAMTSLRRSVVVTVVFTLFGGPGLVLVYLPWLITGFRIPLHPPPAQIIAAVVFIVLGLIPLLESIVRFVVAGRGTLMPAVPTERLVVSGLYRYVRNPMYIGVITTLAGEALLFRSRHMLEYALVVWAIMHFFVCLYEEPRLTGTYPDSYRTYRNNVPRWFPRLSPWRGTAPPDVE